jgi:hypothetical protein
MAKCKCTVCAQSIEFDLKDEWRIGPCPHCGKDTLLRSPLTEDSAIKSPAMSQTSHVQKRLESIRGNSCYKTLRGVIDICFIVSAILVFVAVAACWGGYGEVHPVIATILGVVAIVILIAGKQSSLLLVDIADAILHNHSSNKLKNE